MEFELWKSIDPSQAAIKIKELKDYGSRGDFYRLVSVVELNGKTYFSFYQSYTGVDSGTTAADIWETDGTTENTTLLFDVTPQHLTTFIPELIAKDDALYYIFYDTQFGPDIRRYCP